MSQTKHGVTMSVPAIEQLTVTKVITEVMHKFGIDPEQSPYAKAMHGVLMEKPMTIDVLHLMLNLIGSKSPRWCVYMQLCACGEMKVAGATDEQKAWLAASSVPTLTT